MQETQDNVPASIFGRRKFLKGTSVAGVGVAAASFLGAAGASATTLSGAMPSVTQSQSPGVPGTPLILSANDTAILNFALNLEYLEANFYTVATTGETISKIGIGISGTGEEGSVYGGAKVNFSSHPAVGTIAKQIAEDEQNHVKLLRALLGSKAVAQPEINLGALGVASTLTEFLALARAFEDVGVSAYGGAAPLLQSDAVLAIAARIALTEGEHTGNLRLLVAQNNVPTMKLDAQDILPPPSGTEYFSNVAGLTIVRNTSEVLAIVYANKMAGARRGGFFPNGFNGPINTVA